MTRRDAVLTLVYLAALVAAGWAVVHTVSELLAFQQPV